MARQQREKEKHYLCRPNHPLTSCLLKRGVLDGTIPSAVSDTGATSSAGLSSDRTSFCATGQRSTKVFRLPNGSAAPASEVRILQQPLCDPARTIGMVPSLCGTSLLITIKLANAGYVTVYDGDEVNVYGGRTAKIKISEAAVLQGWRCPRERLWRIPLTSNVKNISTYTLLLYIPDGSNTLNALYSVPPVSAMRRHIDAMQECPLPGEAINHVYGLPSAETALRYLHEATGFPTKATWLKAARKGNFLSWPLVNVKNVHKYFPKSEETQRGHMSSQRQGVRSTRPALPRDNAKEVHLTPTEKKHQDFIVKVYNVKQTLYSEQTGQLPETSSRGNKYQMCLHEIDSNTTWVEPMLSRTERSMISDLANRISLMRAASLDPKNQILDNEASAKYKSAITNSSMTYQLVPPKYHQRNIDEKSTQFWKNHFIAVLSGAARTPPPSASGARSSLRRKGNSSSSAKATQIQKSLPTHTCTAQIITLSSLLSSLAWKPWSTTRQAYEGPGPNMHQKYGS